MLRELNEVVTELQDSVAPLATAARAGVRVTTLDMTLPLDMRTVLRGGGCVLLADVPRNTADANWRDTPTRLHLRWETTPAGFDAGEGSTP